MGRPSNLRAAALCLGFLVMGGPVAWADLLTFEDAVTIQEAGFSADPTGALVVRPILTRLATVDELRAIAEGDSDADGVLNLQDACPINPFCLTKADLVDADGDGQPKWGDVDDADPARYLFGDPARDELARSDMFTRFLVEFPTPVALGEYVLTQNQTAGLYPVSSLLSLASAGGFTSATIQVWQDRFSPPECGEDARERCRQKCKDSAPPPGKGSKGRGHDLGPCLAECAKIPPKCPTPKPKPKPSKGGKP